MRPTATRPRAIRDNGRQVGSGGTSNETSTSPESAARSSRIRAVELAQPADDLVEHGQRVRRGVRRVELGELLGHLDGGAVPLEALLGGDPLRRQALGLAGLLEHRAALDEVGFGRRPALLGARQRVAVTLELGQRELALLDEPALALDVVLGDLEPPGVLRALRLELEDALLEAVASPGTSRGRRR